jgi:hypothetical protein
VALEQAQEALDRVGRVAHREDLPGRLHGRIVPLGGLLESRE